MPVLLSYALYSSFLDTYQATYPQILIDSGAFSELNTGKRVDGEAYKDWHQHWPHADAIAGLDDISGNYHRSLANYRLYGGFPTIHDTDPYEILDELIGISRAQGNHWLGIGLLPPRQGKEAFVRRVLDDVPDDIHVHGWALRQYRHLPRINSLDSTNWWRDAMDIRVLPLCRHLTYGECLEVVVRRYQREGREVDTRPTKKQAQIDLFS